MKKVFVVEGLSSSQQGRHGGECVHDAISSLWKMDDSACRILEG